MNEHHNPTHGDSGKRPADTVREGTDRAKAKASQAIDEARHQGKDRLNVQKDRAAGQAEKLSDALRQASARLRDEGEPSLARYTEQAASTVSNLAEKFRGCSVDDLIRDTKNLARREPVLFLAGSVALGFAVSRFFKASSTDNELGQRATAGVSERFP